MFETTNQMIYSWSSGHLTVMENAPFASRATARKSHPQHNYAGRPYLITTHGLSPGAAYSQEMVNIHYLLMSSPSFCAFHHQRNKSPLGP